uniref:Uncharacterized protein n=1 Tax=Rhizophora mucronata TaxID=61149 RepID=A0A2P2PE04_RHIMU
MLQIPASGISPSNPLSDTLK